MWTTSYQTHQNFYNYVIPLLIYILDAVNFHGNILWHDVPFNDDTEEYRQLNAPRSECRNFLLIVQDSMGSRVI